MSMKILNPVKETGKLEKHRHTGEKSHYVCRDDSGRPVASTISKRELIAAAVISIEKKYQDGRWMPSPKSAKTFFFDSQNKIGKGQSKKYIDAFVSGNLQLTEDERITAVVMFKI